MESKNSSGRNMSHLWKTLLRKWRESKESSRANSEVFTATNFFMRLAAKKKKKQSGLTQPTSRRVRISLGHHYSLQRNPIFWVLYQESDCPLDEVDTFPPITPSFASGLRH
ncbi:hypothetical protein RRG08_025235 [Elysia crispata]|uniref:Uncharacterized protein n=1 Tax=Elysia crispata TaxID=231223 RepID=A0AAE1AB81_9GAST|nr:hypothetical protein RRG08_025235 [Elysia crispata]